MPISSPRICPVLIGRDAEIAILLQLLQESADGRGSFVLLSGEAGAGKTRLQRELTKRGIGLGFQVLVGGCSERDRDFPFAPFVDGLRQYLAERISDSGAAFGPQAGILGELLPELASIQGYRSTGSVSPLTPEQNKRKLFEAIIGCITYLAAQKPVLLVLEDLHWADPTSLELLELLPRRLASDRLLLLSTARSDEFNEDLLRCLMTLRRQRLLVEITLEPLSGDEVGQMLGVLLSVAPQPRLTAEIHSRTNGNPFFIEELVASLPTDAGQTRLVNDLMIPRNVRDTILRQLSGFDSPARQIADLAAVVGQRFSLELLRGTCDLLDNELDRALESLIERQILIEEQRPGRTLISFRHALMREVIHGQLQRHQRRVLHGLVGETLEDLARDEAWSPSEGDLGYHFHEAGIWQKALGYSIEAGDAAWGVHATTEALRHYRRALDAALRLDDPHAAQLHLRCGRALVLIGSFDAALWHLEEAQRLSKVRQNMDVEQEALYELAGLFASRDYRGAEDLAREALTLARGRVNRRVEGLALNRLGNVLTNVLHFRESRALHEEALGLFESLEDSWGSADSLDLIGMNRYLAGDVIEARTTFGHAAVMFDALRDPARLASALTSRGLYLAVLDGPCASDVPPETYRADAEAGLRLCQEIDWRPGEAYALVALACADLGLGHFASAFDHAETALTLATEINHQQWMVIALLTLGLIHVELYDDRGALERFEQAREIARAIGSRQWEERLTAWSARCRVRLGDDETARVTLNRLVPSNLVPETIGQRRALFTLAELDLWYGEPEVALRYVDVLAGTSAVASPAVTFLRGEILQVLQRLDEADAEFEHAATHAASFGPRTLLRRIAAARSRLWEQHDASRSRQQAGVARQELHALMSFLPPGPLRTRYLESSEVRPWLDVPTRSRTARTAGPGGLTAREFEVATWVARGLTNKEIAGELSLSEKTIEMHVSNCLGKLHLSTRTQLAAWWIEQQ